MNKPSTINKLPNDDAVASRARTLFDDACAGADSYHTLRLGLARRKALAAATSRPAAWRWAPWAGGVAACCALVAAVMLVRPGSYAPAPAAAHDQSSAPIAAVAAGGDTHDAAEIGSSQMEMVQDLGFYRWLAAQPDAGASTQRGGR